ncbi:MAG: DNA polymerase IV, partial [Rhizobiales bacterium]|nr:DNA polymerase IV [Hyphomicrobiales bacterium]
PSLADKPVIVGGGTRGVVSTCCYIARIRGVRSAMPMFKALKLAPDAVVIKPNMAKYSEVGHQVRELMLAVTPLVEPLSIDEAFLDLTGTARLHGRPPAKTLAVLIREIEQKIGITASVGLAPNKYLAKVASDLEKPRGYSVIGRTEALGFLAGKPVSLIWGVGKAMQETLAKDGITGIGQLQRMEKNDLLRRYGSMGARLYHLSRGEDMRTVSTDDTSKSIGAETTLDRDVADYGELEALLWAMAQKVSRRAKEQGYGGYTVTLKLKTRDFRLRTRATTLEDPTQLAHRMFDAAKPLLRKEVTGTEFRLIGIALSHLEEMTEGDEATLDPRLEANSKAEKAIDLIREKFGKEAVDRGLSLKVKD